MRRFWKVDEAFAKASFFFLRMVLGQKYTVRAKIMSFAQIGFHFGMEISKMMKTRKGG